MAANMKGERPQPLPHHKDAEPIPAGPGRLEATAKRFLNRLRSEELKDLHAWLACVLQGSLDMGSVCSGTDSPVLAWHAFAAAAEDVLGARLLVNHRYAAERNPAKQEFLRAAFPNLTIFQDATKLDAPVAITREGHYVQVANSLQHLIAGFPCTSSSKLNPHSTSEANMSCVANADLATGSVFNGIVKNMLQHGSHMQFLVLENVTALASCTPGRLSNLDMVVQLLRSELSMVTKVWHLDPRDFGTPQCRPRLWMSCVPKRELKRMGISEHVAGAILSDVMNRLAGSRLAPLDDFLLDDEDEVLEEERKEMRGCCATGDADTAIGLLATGGILRPGKRACPKKAEPAACKWPRIHERLFRAKGLCWTEAKPLDEDVAHAYPGLHALSARQLEVLELAGVRDFPETVGRCVEVSQGAGRQSPRVGCASTVTPHGQQYLTHRCRLLHAIECLHLQGIHFPRSLLQKFPSRLIQDLAGNAFETSCCLATIVASSVLLSTGAAAGIAGCPRPPLGPLGVPPKAQGTAASADDDDASSDTDYADVLALGGQA